MKRQMPAIMLILMTNFIGFGIVIPVLPELVSPFHLNMMLILYSAVSFVLSPLWGSLSDKIGRRPVLLLGLAGFAVSFFLLGIAGDSLWLMYVSRILGGAFSGAATSCAVAYVADITTEENRTKGMGLVGMSIGLGFIFGPAIGGLLAGIELSVPFFVSAALSFVTLLFAASRLPESLTPEKRAAIGKRESRWKAFTGSLKYLYMLSFFVTFTLAGVEGTLQYFEIEKFGATPKDIGIMFLVSGIVGAAVQGGVVRKYVKQGDEPKVIGIGLVFSAAGFFLLLFSSSLLNASLFLTVFSIGNNLIRPCVLSLITQKAKTGQGVATGLNSSMDSLGRIFGPLMGVTAFHLHINLPLILGGLLCLGAILLLVPFVAGERRQANEQAAG